MAMKLSHEERRRTRELVGLDPLDSCPVVIVDGPRSPRLVGMEGHYVDHAGEWIHTAEEMQRAGPRGRRYVVATRRIEVGQSWLLGYRAGGAEYVKRSPR